MKVRTRWTYGYSRDDTFEEVVEVEDGLDEDAMKDAVMDAIAEEGNAALAPVQSEFPGDPVEEFLSFTVVDDNTPATIPASETPPAGSIFLVGWTGGFELPSYVAKRTKAEADEQMAKWEADAKEGDGDRVDLLRIDLATMTIEIVG